MLFQEDFWNITYYNHVRLFADLSEVEGSSPITRGKWFEFIQHIVYVPKSFSVNFFETGMLKECHAHLQNLEI